MSFRGVFIAIVLGTAMVVSAFVLQSKRPRIEVARPTAALVRAAGKCAEHHRQETSAIGHQYGAPAFAPLLFADLAVLAALGLWALDRTLPEAAPASVRPPETSPASTPA